MVNERKVFDLELLKEYVMEVSFQVCRASNTCVAVDIGNGFCLCFENTPEKDDTAIYFEGTNDVKSGWHSHGDIFRLIIEFRELFERKGDSIVTLPLAILDGLLEGAILVEASRFSAKSNFFVSLESGLEPYNTRSIEPGESVLLYRPRPVASDRPGG